MESLYINNKSRLSKELITRRKNFSEIKFRLNSWAQKQYGIHDLYSLILKHFGFVSDRGSAFGVLCRQIPSVFIEDATSFVISRALGLIPVAISFYEDIFTSTCSYKACLIQPSFIGWSKKGKRMDSKIRIARGFRDAVLSKIPLEEPNGFKYPFAYPYGQKTLIGFHQELRNRAFGNLYSIADISAYFHDCLLAAGKKPHQVYEFRMDGAVASKKSIKDVNISDCRPVSDWYYPLYLAIFLFNTVLLETYEGNIVHSTITGVFRHSMQELQKNVGLMPMVSQIENFVDLAFINCHLLEKPIDSDLLLENIQETDDILGLFTQVSQKLFIFGKPE